MADSMLAEGFVFAWVWALLLLPLPWLARRLMKAAPDAGMQALRVPWFALMSEASAGWMKKPLLATLAALAWLLLVSAAARPQWVGEPVALRITGRDLMLAVDLSGSMKRRDMKVGDQWVSRLDVVKQVAGEFIERRDGDRDDGRRDRDRHRVEQ